MKFRELLRYEIWSKRTTRKIVIGFVIFAGLLYVGWKTWYEFQLHWLTKGERIAAKLALQKIDALQDEDTLSDEELDFRQHEAVAALEAAGNAARTIKDNLVSMELGDCYLDPMLLKAAKQRLMQQGKWRDRKRDPEEETIESSLITNAQQNCASVRKELQ
jgi:predicted negative regulator of RcsB-dependent stress response